MRYQIQDILISRGGDSVSADSIAKQKSMAFAKRIVGLYQYLTEEHHEHILSKQELRSGTGIGANIAEAVYGSSRKDFLAKLQIAQKEAAETLYWLELLNSSAYLPDVLYQSLSGDCGELLAMLTASIRSGSK